MIYKIF